MFVECSTEKSKCEPENGGGTGENFFNLKTNCNYLCLIL